MALRPEQLDAALARGLRPLYTLTGDEPLQAQEAADAIRAAARAAGYTERQVFVVSGAHFDWSAVLGAAQSQSLFAERQIIEIRIPTGKPGKDGAEALQRYCAQPPEEVLTLVHLPRLDAQTARTAWFAALENAGVVVRADPLPRNTLPAWLGQRLTRQGQRVQDGEDGLRTLNFMADCVEGNLLAAHQELGKLALLYPPGELHLEQVQSAVLDLARFDAQQLSEAVWNGQVGRALRILDALRAAAEAPVRVHWLLSEDLRALARGSAALARGLPLPLAVKEARAWGRERWLESLLPRVSPTQSRALLLAASVCDGVLKGLRHPDWPAEGWDALRRLLLLMLQTAGDGRAPRVRLALRAG